MTSIVEILKQLNIRDTPLRVTNESDRLKRSVFPYRAVIFILIFIAVLTIATIGFKSIKNDVPPELVNQTTTDSVLITEKKELPDEESEKPITKTNISADNPVATKKTMDTNSESINPLTPPRAELKSGWLKVDCRPWAKVYLESGYLDSTPFGKPLAVPAGEHTIRFVHPNYPEYKTKIHLHPDELLNVSVNLDTTVGYFKCRVFPWGEVYIDSNHIGQTPIKQAVRLLPGHHTLSIKNPGYKLFNEQFDINKGDTLRLEINLETINSNTAVKM